MSTRKPRGRVGRIFWLLAAVAMIVAVMPLAGAGANGPITTTYPDQNLSGGGLDSGHFGDVYDLTANDMTLSFTYDGYGLVDESGEAAHAWAELGVRSEDTVVNPPEPLNQGFDFNPYWRVTGYDGIIVDLLAGQDTDMGDVTVTSDATYLYVTYHLDDGWCMTQSHFAVATEWKDLPQTKKGNSIPGKFPYGDDYDPCATGDVALDPIPFDDIEGFTPGDTLYFAAHANVTGAVADCVETVWQIGDVEEMVEYPVGTANAGQILYTNYADEFNWSDPAGPFTKGPGLTAEKPDYADPFVVGTNLDEEFPYNSNASTANFYATDFDVDWYGDLPFGGELYFSWSPGQSAAEKKVISDGVVSEIVNRAGVPISGQGYFLDTYPVYTEGPIVLGPYGTDTHTINFLHEKGDGTFWDWIRLEAPCERYETAWGEGEDFPGKDWSMYFSIDPTLAEGSGVWLATDYRWAQDTLEPDPAGALADGASCPAAPCLDNDDKMMLQRVGGDGEAAYNLPGTPPNQWANHAFWFDRDGVDKWQALMWGMIDGVTYNTGGVYDVVITLHADSATTGTAYMTVNGEDQGFYVPNWHHGPLVPGTDLYPAGMTFTGDMEHLVVFYGLFGYGAAHEVTFSDIAVTQ